MGFLQVQGDIILVTLQVVLLVLLLAQVDQARITEAHLVILLTTTPANFELVTVLNHRCNINHDWLVLCSWQFGRPFYLQILTWKLSRR